MYYALGTPYSSNTQQAGGGKSTATQQQLLPSGEADVVYNSSSQRVLFFSPAPTLVGRGLKRVTHTHARHHRHHIVIIMSHQKYHCCNTHIHTEQYINVITHTHPSILPPSGQKNQKKKKGFLFLFLLIVLCGKKKKGIKKE